MGKLSYIQIYHKAVGSLCKIPHSSKVIGYATFFSYWQCDSTKIPPWKKENVGLCIWWGDQEKTMLGQKCPHEEKENVDRSYI